MHGPVVTKAAPWVLLPRGLGWILGLRSSPELVAQGHPRAAAPQRPDAALSRENQGRSWPLRTRTRGSRPRGLSSWQLSEQHAGLWSFLVPPSLPSAGGQMAGPGECRRGGAVLWSPSMSTLSGPRPSRAPVWRTSPPALVRVTGGSAGAAPRPVRTRNVPFTGAALPDSSVPPRGRCGPGGCGVRARAYLPCTPPRGGRLPDPQAHRSTALQDPGPEPRSHGGRRGGPRPAPPQGAARTRPQTKAGLGPSYTCPPHLLENMVPRTFQPQSAWVGGPACIEGSSLVSGGPGLGTSVELAGRRGQAAMLTLSYLIARSAGAIRQAARRHRQVQAGARADGSGWSCSCCGYPRAPRVGSPATGRGAITATRPFPLSPSPSG